MESLNPEFALNVSKNERTKTDTVFPLSEVSSGAMTLMLDELVKFLRYFGFKVFKNFYIAVIN